MSRCGYDNEIQRLCVGQKPRGIDQVYNHDEQWIIRKMAFEAAHDYIAELVGAKRAGKVVRLQRTNPLDPIKAELLGRLRHFCSSLNCKQRKVATSKRYVTKARLTSYGLVAGTAMRSYFCNQFHSTAAE